MSRKIKRLPDEPIIVATWIEPVDIQKEFPQKFAEVDALIGADEEVCVVDDLTNLKIDFSTLVSGMAAQRAKIPGAPFDPRIHSILVGSGTLWELASKGARQLQYGKLDIPLFPSLEEALGYAREKIKSW